MKFLKPIIKNISIVLFAFTTITAPAQTTSIQTIDGRTLSIEKWNTAIEEAMKEHQLPGLSFG